MSYDNNIYYNPSASGLELILQLDQPDLCYEYNTLIILQHTESGRLYYAVDSGCSCPVPFEEFYFNGPDKDHDLTEITLNNFEPFERKVESFPVPQHDRTEAIDTARAILKQRVAQRLSKYVI